MKSNFSTVPGSIFHRSSLILFATLNSRSLAILPIGGLKYFLASEIKKKYFQCFLINFLRCQKNFGSYLLQEKKPFGDISKTFLVINFVKTAFNFGHKIPTKFPLCDVGSWPTTIYRIVGFIGFF